MDNINKLEKLLSDIKGYQKIDVIADVITAKSTKEIAGPDDEKQRALLTEIRDHLATIVKGLFGSGVGGGNNGPFLGKGPNNTPLLPGPKSGPKEVKSKSPFTESAVEFFGGIKDSYAEMIRFFSSKKDEEEKKATDLVKTSETKQKDDDKEVPEGRSVIEVLESIDSRLAKMQLFSKSKSDVIDVNVGEQKNLPGIEPPSLPPSSSSLKFEILSDITDVVDQLEKQIEKSKLDPDVQNALADELSQVGKKLKYKPAKKDSSKKPTSSATGASDKSSIMMADVPTYLRKKRGTKPLELKDVSTNTTKGAYVTSTVPTSNAKAAVKPTPSVTTQSGATISQSSTMSGSAPLSQAGTIKDEKKPDQQATAEPETGSGVMDTISTVASVAGSLGGLSKAAKLGKAAKVGGGMLKGVGAGAKILGKVAAPLAVAMAVGDAVGGFMNAKDNLDIEGRDATLGEKLSSAGGGLISGLSFGILDEKKMSKGIASFFGAGPDQPKTEGAELHKESVQRDEMDKIKESGGSGNKAIVNNTTNNNNTNTMIPMRPTPRAQDTSFERYVNRVTMG